MKIKSKAYTKMFTIALIIVIIRFPFCVMFIKIIYENTVLGFYHFW